DGVGRFRPEARLAVQRAPEVVGRRTRAARGPEIERDLREVGPELQELAPASEEDVPVALVVPPLRRAEPLAGPDARRERAVRVEREELVVGAPAVVAGIDRDEREGDGLSPVFLVDAKRLGRGIGVDAEGQRDAGVRERTLRALVEDAAALALDV